MPQEDCIASAHESWENITLRNILIRNAKYSPGVLLGNTSNPMRNITFDNVVFTGEIGKRPRKHRGDDYYVCEGVQGISINSYPDPPCLQKNDTIPPNSRANEITGNYKKSSSHHHSSDTNNNKYHHSDNSEKHKQEDEKEKKKSKSKSK